MNLHQTSTRADWETTPLKKRNQWQRIAAATNGILTPGNFLTLIGLLLVVYAIEQIILGTIWNGIIALTIGRLCDMLDGRVADITGTKSFLGEFFDAATDKFATILTLCVLATMYIVPWVILIGLMLPHLIIPIIIYSQRHRGVITHPSRIGKLSMAGLWISVIGYLLQYALGAAMPDMLLCVVYVITILSVMGGFIALRNYAVQPVR